MSEQPVEEQTAIVETPQKRQPLRPVVTAEQGKKLWEDFLKLKDAVLTSDDIVHAKVKQRDGTYKDVDYINKSGFRKLAMAFDLSDRIIEQTRTDRDDHTFFWRIVVEAQANNGRTAVGVAICDSAERTFYHAEHDVYATAHTRAKNRAISDLIAGGAVSAEEMETAGSEVAPQPSPSQKTSPKISPKKGNNEERVFTFKGESDVRGQDGGFK